MTLLSVTAERVNSIAVFADGSHYVSASEFYDIQHLNATGLFLKSRMKTNNIG